MEYKVRKAKKEDEKRILELGVKIADKYERTHLGDEIVDEFINSGMCEKSYLKNFNSITVLLDNEIIIGFIIIVENEIVGLLIDIPYWGSGCGTYIVNYAIENLFAGYNEITLECFESSKRANGFYIKMGFTSKGIVEGDGGRRILYSKSI